MKNKKVFWFVLGGLDVALVTFFFVINIIMLANIIGKSAADVQILAMQGKGLVPWLINHKWGYFFLFVFPIILIFIANVVAVIIYVKRNAKAKVSLQDLSEEEKEALQKELLKDLQDK